jgi:hypothetical protein
VRDPLIDEVARLRLHSHQATALLADRRLDVLMLGALEQPAAAPAL